MSKSVLLRVPWINEECLIVCDRFHYRAHTCNSNWDPDSYLSCNKHSSPSAEAINHLWTFSKSHLRFLRPENVMPFLTARSVFINLRAVIRRKKGKAELNAKIFRTTIREMWNCECINFAK